MTHPLVSDIPKTKKEFLKIIKKPRPVIYKDYKGDQHSKQLKLGKEGALMPRSCLSKESKHTGKWTLTSLWDEIADLYVRYRPRVCLNCARRMVRANTA